ncbi:PfkB family carbohydrate kinase [Myceligenerans cantabricum]
MSDGERVPTAARELREPGAQIAVVKRGADGAVTASEDGDFSAAGVPVDVRETVCTGDLFVAGSSPTPWPAMTCRPPW